MLKELLTGCGTNHGSLSGISEDLGFSLIFFGMRQEEVSGKNYFAYHDTCGLLHTLHSCNLKKLFLFFE